MGERDVARTGTRVDGGRVGAILGAGRMGVVHAYVHPERGPGALKFLRTDAAAGWAGTPPGAARRSVLEALLVALEPGLALAHPALVPLRAVGRTGDRGDADDTVYLEMARVEGPTLEEILANDGPLPWSEAFVVAADLAAGLAAMHAAGWVHGDVKPDNLVLTGFGGGAVRLLDLLDHRVASVLLAQGGARGIFGTPHYAAPEVAAGAVADGLADVYGLGLLLVDLTTGHPAVDGDSPQEILRLHREGPRVLPVLDGLPAAEAALWARMVERDPSLRPTAAEVAAALGG